MGVSKASVALLALATLASAGLVPRTTSKQVYPGFKNLKYIFSLCVEPFPPFFLDGLRSDYGGSGDSYTQTGFNMTNGSPMPAPGNPLGNPAYPGWTSAK